MPHVHTALGSKSEVHPRSYAAASDKVQTTVAVPWLKLTGARLHVQARPPALRTASDTARNETCKHARCVVREL